LHSASLSHFIINVLQHASIFSLSFGNGFQRQQRDKQFYHNIPEL